MKVSLYNIILEILAVQLKGKEKENKCVLRIIYEERKLSTFYRKLVWISGQSIRIYFYFYTPAAVIKINS